METRYVYNVLPRVVFVKCVLCKSCKLLLEDCCGFLQYPQSVLHAGEFRKQPAAHPKLWKTIQQIIQFIFFDDRPVDTDYQRDIRIFFQQFDPFEKLRAVPAVEEFELDAFSVPGPGEGEIREDDLLISGIDKRSIAHDFPIG